VSRYGGIEAGGTKWVCALGDGPDALDSVVFPTTTPEETIGRAVEFFAANGRPAALGVGSFGPIDRVRGAITTTPKPGWAETDVVGAFRSALGVPVVLDTDVNAAALGEQRWGAAVGVETFCYVTVGTGIGGGAVVDGRLVHGLSHPELGHMRIPHDLERDPFQGSCPFHGDCFEGLASGEAMRARWGTSAQALDDEAAWELEADYLAHGLVNVICALSPELIVLGGGVSKRDGLITRVRERIVELLAGYVAVPDVVAPALGDRAGVLGAIELAQRGA
jgi:fructokinase